MASENSFNHKPLNWVRVAERRSLPPQSSASSDQKKHVVTPFQLFMIFFNWTSWALGRKGFCSGATVRWQGGSQLGLIQLQDDSKTLSCSLALFEGLWLVLIAGFQSLCFFVFFVMNKILVWTIILQSIDLPDGLGVMATIAFLFVSR